MIDTYDDEELKDIIDNEGFGYAVQYYLNPEKIECEDTKRLWIEAAKAMDALAEHLAL